jgi:hypothetical protein
MARKIGILALATALLVGTALAQSPPPIGNPPIAQRAINITAEQGYVIKENVLKDNKPANVPARSVEIGGKAPSDVVLRDFPQFVMDKVSSIKSYKFFVADNGVIIVDPKDRTIADIIK